MIVLLQIFSNSEISLKIGQYLMKLRRTKNMPIFGPPYILHIEKDEWGLRIGDDLRYCF